MRYVLLLGVLLTHCGAFAQNQVIRGQVRDKESHQPLQHVRVLITGPELGPGRDSIGPSTEANGEFQLNNIPPGRYDINFHLASYKDLTMNNVVLSSAKEVVLQVELEEELKAIETVTIVSKTQPGQPGNENALVSARLFTVDETDRFAGSRGDPARMASNFAGVQGADDSRNDIVVRGNSPQGVLWRLEGIDIPNPNHFAIPGTTGGPVSIINNKILANSDFFTGAFPAEYGNSTAGVFDLKMRNGNSRKYEFSSQLGFLGWDLLAEGPLNKRSGSSFMFTYRYSTLALFSALKIPIGTDAVPSYQDASFKLNFPIRGHGNLSFFGIGGGSHINILISDQKKSGTNIYGDNDRDQYFSSGMYVAGSSLMYNLNKKSYLKATIANSMQLVNAHHALVFRHVTDTFEKDGDRFYRYALDSIVPNLQYEFRTRSLGLNSFINTKFSASSSIRYGMQLTRYSYSFTDSARNFDFMDSQNYWKWNTRWNSQGLGMLFQPYFQYRWKPSEKWLITAGLMSQVFSIMDKRDGIYHTDISYAEPRLGIRYNATKRDMLNFGMGFHSQIQPAYTYFYIKPGNTRPHNLDMGLTHSKQFVLGWDHSLKHSRRFKMETYYQFLTRLPVETRSSSFSLANTGSGFSRFFPDTLENTGTGRNYGLEFTFEQFFSKGMYYLLTLSVFDAKYKGSDGVLRNSDFNTGYAGNALLAKEWKTGKRSTLNLGGKFTMAGARRYSPMDTLATRRNREYTEIDALKNSKTFGQGYLRLDVRVSFKINSKKFTHEFAIDLVNVSNRKNVLKYSYISEAPYNKQDYQLGFLPLFYYKLDF